MSVAHADPLKYGAAYSCESDAQGAFAFDKVASGKYEIHATQGRKAKGTTTGVEVAVGGQRADVVVTVK